MTKLLCSLIFAFFGLTTLAEAPVTGSGDFIALHSGSVAPIDKTLFIEDLIKSNQLVTLITRPRRWGKTTNLSMLKYFFEIGVDRNGNALSTNLYRQLFSELTIGSRMVPGTKLTFVDKYQGKYPVIFMTLKDIRGEDFFQMKYKLIRTLYHEYARHSYLMESPALNNHGLRAEQYAALLKTFSQCATGVYDQNIIRSIDASDSLLVLSQFLHAHTGKKVIILVDEYDTPINHAFHKHYAEEALEFMRDILGPALKDNPHLEQGVFTGILRFAKANLFSGINNFVEANLINGRYATHYGFTEPETQKLLKQAGLENRLDEVREWYNGYQINRVKLYNPWSIANFLAEGRLEPYWVDTGSTDMIDRAILSESIQNELETLRAGNAVFKPIRTNLLLADIEQSDEALWSLLFYTGYLTFETSSEIPDPSETQLPALKIPNREVHTAFTNFFRRWLESKNLGSERIIREIELVFSLIAEEKVDELQSLLLKIDAPKFDGRWNFNWLHIASLAKNKAVYDLVAKRFPEQEALLARENLGRDDFEFLGGQGRSGNSKRLRIDSMQPSCFSIPSMDTVNVAGKTVIAAAAVAVFEGILQWNKEKLSPFMLAYSKLIATVAGLTGGIIIHCVTQTDSVDISKPEKFSNLIQFEKYLRYNPESYVTLNACQNHPLISQIHFKPLDMPYISMRAISFSLCGSESRKNADL
ncbi:MAG: AAA family ATPase [Myxococcaceae bacterium]|nr:AAA family ATPase [Myxococcaceae bacterium]MBH2005910.1 AAA family ATPase [Myxococcaceae bacterium]